VNRTSTEIKGNRKLIATISFQQYYEMFVAIIMFICSQPILATQYDMKGFGGIPNEASLTAATTNGAALYTGLAFMNPGDELVISRNDTFYIIPPSDTVATNCFFVTLRIAGTLKLHNDSSAWPTYDNGKKIANAIDIQQSEGVKVLGGGTIDGQGHSWWWEFLLGKVSRYRPTLLNLAGCVGCLVEDIHFVNSPRFHLYGSLLIGLEVRNVSVRVDVVSQRALVERFLGTTLRGLPPYNDADHTISAANTIDFPVGRNGPWWSLLPCFPFNTDGVDVEGRNIHIHNVTVNNYDDSVCVKPVYAPGFALGIPVNATENVLVENIQQIIGVGVSVGSVSPNANHARVVRNVTFRNISAINPLKLVYIKTGTGGGVGSISDVVYESITAEGAVVLSPIYLGPQQQSEPDGDGAGWWPITEPAISISNIIFRNINVTGGLYPLSAGVLRCNASNPCHGISFENVNIDRTHSYICGGNGTMYGGYDNNSRPSPDDCLSVPLGHN